MASVDIQLDKVMVQPLQVPLGLVFEKISMVKMYQRQWTIVTHLNISTINAQWNHIKNLTESANNICEAIKTKHYEPFRFSQHCGLILSQVNTLVSEIDMFNLEWFGENNQQVINTTNTIDTEKK